MNTHDILLTVQYITISALFIETLIVFFRWKNSIHSCLILACLASFISNMGYLFEMKAENEEAFFTALKLSYVGRIWIVLAFFLFAAKMCRKRIPKWVLLFLVAIHTGFYLAVLTAGSGSLYYTDYQFIPGRPFPVFIHGNGIVHDLFIMTNAVLIVLSMSWVLREFIREENRSFKKRLLFLIFAFSVQIISFVLEISNVFYISRYYDLTMLGALFGTAFMLTGILKFDLLGTREIARDFAIDRISEGIIAVDNEGRIRYYNEPAARIYPQFNAFYSTEPGGMEAVDREAPIYTPYDIVAFIDDAIRTGDTLKVGDRIFTPEQNDLVYKGESYGRLYALVDDTEHFRYMEELKKQKEIADNANNAKSRFLANMSHEIRTPINAVLGMDEMILRESEDNAIRSYAADIMSAGHTLLSLINDILDLSKVEEGRMEIIPVQYDLSVLINDIVNMIRDRAAQKGLEFSVKADEHIPRLLLGDEIRIRQCVMNLLTNAVKYTEAGGVTLTVSSTEKDKDHILLKFTVEDTGIGMKEEDMEYLFSPYMRIEEERNRTIEGTGLGMTITRQLLELMGSTLRVKSEYGKGSVFSFEMEQEVISREELGESSHHFHNAADKLEEYHELFHAPEARILVIDDTEMNLTVMQNLLKKTRIQIDTALSGREGLKLAEDNQYDVCFIDHMMPDLDGIETLRLIRKMEKNREIPAVALTANAISGAREMYLNAGFTDYLSKPIDGAGLEKMLCALLPDEKLQAPDSVCGEEEGQPAGSDNGSALESLKDIDTKEGIINCGSEEGYLSVLSVFHRTAAFKADEIEEYYRKGDIENYTVKVHALKSSARIIGAGSIFELALSLEEAGNRGDKAYIEANTGRLLDMYRTLDDKLSFLDRSEDDLPPIGSDTLKEAYQTIYEIAGSMDYGMMEDMLEKLNGYILPAEDREIISRIEAMLTQLDWDGIIQLAGERAG